MEKGRPPKEFVSHEDGFLGCVQNMPQTVTDVERYRSMKEVGLSREARTFYAMKVPVSIVHGFFNYYYYLEERGKSL